jgi:hypothetical protein
MKNPIPHALVLSRKISIFIWKIPLFFHILIFLTSIFSLILNTNASIQQSKNLRTLKLSILSEQKLIKAHKLQHNEYLAEWETLTAPQSLQKLSQQYLPTFQPIQKIHSISDLPPPKDHEQ